MRRLAVFSLLLLITLSLCAANSGPMNLDFENGSPGEVPPGWISPTTTLGYTAELTADRPKQGKQAVRVSGTPTGGRSFGNVMQTIDATAYRGKRVRLRGAVRVEGAGATSALWMRVDRAAKQMGFFDNMQDRPITSAEWGYYEIAGDIADDAETLNVGMMLLGTGTAWLDDVTIETLAKAPVRSAPARALTPRGLENLIAFTRLFGIVRHFHPSDEAAAADWEAVAVNGAESVEGAKDPAELATRLSEVFLPLAPTVRIAAGSLPPGAALEKPADAQTVVSWEHRGLGQKLQRGVYASERVRRTAAEADARYPDPLQPLRLDLGGGVFASVPLSVYADAANTLPRPTREARPMPAATYTGNDRSTRLGAVVLLWNVLQHFYPYFDVVDVDWPAELKTALRAAATDRDEAAFLGTLRRMVASIDDGHGSVQHSSAQHALLPVLWRSIGDSLVVTAVDPAASGISAGDEVIAIDGKPVPQALREAEALISGATTQWRRFNAQREVGTGLAGTQATLTVRNADGSTRTVTLTRDVFKEPLREKRPERIAEVKPGIWYIDLDRANDTDFETALPKLAAAKGIVFDMRGYPRSMTSKPIQHLIDTTIESARWNIPLVRRPDRAGVEWDTRGRWKLEPLQPRLPKNVAFITDGRAISYAESWMGIIEAYKLARIVGEPTAGTNGNINMLQLPGGYRVVFTGMKVLKHDGSRHHGVGILPTVPVTPTLAGIRAGRDEQLEKAVEILEK